MGETQRDKPSAAEALAAKPVAGDSMSPTRRKILIGALAAAPTVVVMANRPAWGSSGCVAPSAWLSVQIAQNNGITLSHQPSTSGYNKGQSPSYWSQGYSGYNPYKLVSPDPYGCEGNSYPSWNASFASLFGTGSTQSYGYILHNMTGTSYYHWVAAHLNALNNNCGSAASIVKYPLTTTQVIAMYNGTFSTSGTVWTVAEGLSYIQTLEG